MTTSVDRQRDAEKRRLRTEIARCRRRIDRGLGRSKEAAGRLASWKTYARRWPGAALAAGLGFGWIAAVGLRPRFLVGLFGARLARQLSRQLTRLFAEELKRVWKDAAPRARGPDRGRGDHA